MIELRSGQLLSIALAVSAVTMGAVGAVFWLVIRAIGHRRGAGWSLAGFSHAAAADRFGQNRFTPRWLPAALAAGTPASLALWARFHLTSPLEVIPMN